MGHTLSQRPQLEGSVRVETQDIPHAVWVEVHDTAQAPELHTCAEGHTVPHAPQLARSV
jgi:hypothetical protein